MEEKKQQNIGREMYEWVQALVCSVLAVVTVIYLVSFSSFRSIILRFVNVLFKKR